MLDCHHDRQHGQSLAKAVLNPTANDVTLGSCNGPDVTNVDSNIKEVVETINQRGDKENSIDEWCSDCHPMQRGTFMH